MNHDTSPVLVYAGNRGVLMPADQFAAISKAENLPTGYMLEGTYASQAVTIYTRECPECHRRDSKHNSRCPFYGK